MKIVVASNNGMVTSHFGHCQEYVMYTIENNQITKKEVIPNPGHKKGYLPLFLSDLGANIVISGGMGSAAIQLFNDKGVKVITGILGEVDIVVKEYLLGKIKSTGSVCNEHRFHNSCE